MMRKAANRVRVAAIAAVVTAGAAGAAFAQQQEGWSVFGHRQGKQAEETPSVPAAPAQREQARVPPSSPAGRPLLAPMDGALGSPRHAQPQDAGRAAPVTAPERLRSGHAIERSSLDPPGPEGGESQFRGAPRQIAEPHSTMGAGAWRGLDGATLEKLFAQLDIPPASPVMAGLWRRLLLTAHESQSDAVQFDALRVEALTRSGLMREASEVLQQLPGQSAMFMVLKARNAIAVGDREAGCAEIEPLLARIQELPDLLKAEGILVSGYCAAATGNPAAAGLAANIARDAGVQISALDALDAVAAGQVPQPPSQQQLAPTEYRILEAAGAANLQVAIDSGSPSLLGALAQSGDMKSPAGLVLSETAAGRNALSPVALAAAYRSFASAPAEAPSETEISLAAGQAMRRAGLFAAAERETDAVKKARLLQVYLEEARKAGLYWPSLHAAGSISEAITPDPRLASFAEAGVEVALAAGRIEQARAWAEIGARHGSGGDGDLTHWLGLVDIADSRPGTRHDAGMAAVEALARGGRFDPALLHRLATVMDALDVDVPIGLWELASQTAQPDDGYLPATGVLTDLQDASKNRELARTVLLVLQAMGPQRAEAVHIIGLGDAIRALRRAGLDAEARTLGLEALLPGWPRTATN